MKKQQCVVDVAKSVLKFPNQQVRLQGSETCDLFYVKNTDLILRSDILVRVKRGTGIVVEDIGHHPSWIMARTLLLTKDIAKVRILNIRDRDVQLKKNSVIRKCLEVIYDMSIRPMRLSVVIQ